MPLGRDVVAVPHELGKRRHAYALFCHPDRA